LDVTIEAVGDLGDGIAKVDRGYAVIVPGSQPGEQESIEVQDVKEYVAFANVIETNPQEIQCRTYPPKLSPVRLLGG
jgi:predicted RNA-binding protein with TRAM domain